jgi:hypothetical protein
MKPKFRRTLALLAGIPIIGGLLTSCSIVGWTTAVAVGTVGVVGYTVYEGGESVVEGVSSIGSSDSSEGSKSETVVFNGKVLKTECHNTTVEEAWLASATALRRAQFKNLAGDYDALSGELRTQTWDQNLVTLQFKAGEQNQTHLSIWVGPDGDLKSEEKIYKLVQEELKKRAAAAQAAGNGTASKETAQ